MDKPPGITSARTVALVKRLLPKKSKIGHTGTLDPLATGLLILLLGRATRLSRYVTGLDKTYAATARFGQESDTLDADGEITPVDAPMPTESQIRELAETFTGELQQTPPMASAVKVGGERLYSIHRRGGTVDRDSRAITVNSLEVTSYDAAQQLVTFDISCSSGTYVRSLIADLADALDTGAHLMALRRTSVGTLHLRQAVSPETLTPENLRNRIIPPARVLSHLPALDVGGGRGRVWQAVCHGREIAVPGLRGSFRVESGGELLAVYGGDGKGGRPEVVLCAGG